MMRNVGYLPWLIPGQPSTPRAQVELVEQGGGRNRTIIITTNSLNNFQFGLKYSPDHLLINKGEWSLVEINSSGSEYFEQMLALLKSLCDFTQVYSY